MALSQLVKLFGGVSQILINKCGLNGYKKPKFQDRSSVNFDLKESNMTINAEVIRTVITSIRYREHCRLKARQILSRLIKISACISKEGT